MTYLTTRADRPSLDRTPLEWRELMDVVADLPPSVRDQIEPAVAEAVEQAQFRGRVLDVAREALERLRLDLALMQFDLEITRKERDALRRKVGEIS